ncbi:UDP-glycosyltransferase UGT5-like [Uranotaenia lowii]|uniref:UDP-glycosyltransferase UGT5-like n=1 Tax=Uranotaenia lowii TaxID=190385 RepID=UPI0024794785|nr:UDP-glycosyltransferase UGT5-like [Uranotaenia lowii]
MLGRSRVLLTVALLAALLRSTGGAKILGILPSTGWSHYVIGEGIMSALNQAGHDVTVIGAHCPKDAPSNYECIVVKDLVFDKGGSTPNLFQYRNDPYLKVLYDLYTMIGPTLSTLLMSHPKVKELLQANRSYDAVISECFVSEALYGFADHYKAPLIVFSPFGASMWTNELVGTPYPYAQIPHVFLSYTDRMTFWERFVNTALWNIDSFYYRNIFLPSQQEMYASFFPNASQSLAEVMKSTSLVLLNQHFSLSYPHPYAPNMIEVGGIQMKEPKALPEDLESFIQNSKNGVIYFSMGSMLKGSNFPEEKRNAFINAFARLKQNVLWKYENVSLPNKPENVQIRKWMPQNDILAHPNVKLFITHGGLLGSTESLFHGKPMIGVPIYGDQRLNMARAERTGYGISIEYEDLNEDLIHQAIEKVLNDPAYAKNAQLISDRYRDKPMTPAQTTVYWVDYVIRHGGAPQLHSAAVELSFVARSTLDVYGTMLLMALLMLASVRYLARKIFRMVGSHPVAKTTKKND